MRGDAHPAAAREPRLSALRRLGEVLRSLPVRGIGGVGSVSRAVPADRPTRRAAAASGVLLLATLFTGITTSPLLPALAAALVLLVRHADRSGWLLAPAGAGALLLAVAAVTGDVGVREIASCVLLTASAAPGLLWRREARRNASRIVKLDEIMTRAADEPAARTTAAEQAAAELADLETGLAAVAARVGARSVVLWEVEPWRGTARARAGSAGRPLVTVVLSGDPLGWTWEQGMRLRLEQTPRWAEAGLRVIVDRLRRHDERGELLTFAFEPGRVPGTDHALDEAGVYLRGLLALQEARALAAADGRRLETLLGGIRSLPGELALKTLAGDLCATAMSLTDGTGAAIGTWGGEDGRVLAVAGEDGGPKAGDVFEAPASELGLAMRADAPIVRDAERWALGRTCIARPDEQWRSRPRALAALPLRGASGALGVLAVWTSRAHALDAQAVDLLRALSPYAALHLEHAREYGELREYADQDALTQLPNRRAFEKALALEAGRFERYGHPLSLMLLDLDHFKGINDHYGHEAGDEVLRRAARTIAACVRDVDVAARLGGEEFVVLLPETSLAAAVDVAERVRTAIAAMPVDWRGTVIPVRVSIGVSACPERVGLPAELVGSADAALYQAKGAGRDRVVTAAVLRPHP